MMTAFYVFWLLFYAAIVVCFERYMWRRLGMSACIPWRKAAPPAAESMPAPLTAPEWSAADQFNETALWAANPLAFCLAPDRWDDGPEMRTDPPAHRPSAPRIIRPPPG